MCFKKLFVREPPPVLSTAVLKLNHQELVDQIVARFFGDILQKTFHFRSVARLPSCLKLVAPLVNLLALASMRHDYASAQHHLSELADLMSSGRLTGRERAYALRRLREHPRLRWLRQTDAWSNGPARWLRRRDVRRTAVASSALAVLLGFLLALGAFTSNLSAPAPDGTTSVSQSAVAAPAHAPMLARGGDSMGKTQPTSGKGGSKGRGRSA